MTIYTGSHTQGSHRCYTHTSLVHHFHTHHVTYITQVQDKIKSAIGPYEDLLTTVKKRKLQWYGHVQDQLVLPKLSCRALWRAVENAVVNENGGKTTSKSGPACRLQDLKERQRTE